MAPVQHVVSRPYPPFASAGGRLEVHQLPAAQDNLEWLVVHPTTREAAVVDGPDADAVLAYCAAHELRLTTVFNTHTHGDHVGINRDLARRGLLAALRVVGPARAAGDVPGLTEPVDDGDRITFAGVVGQVLLTEGHIDGHVSYVFDDLLFCGDTLFAGGCGYLFDGPPAKMHRSLERLATLPAATRVCCAHEYTLDNLRFAWSVEPDNAALVDRIRAVRVIRAAGGSAVPSTIAAERATNPFLRHASPTLCAAVAAAFPERALDTPEQIFAATRALKDRKDYKRIPDSALPG